MSLIEIIIVIALMGTLMTIVITNLTGRQDRAMEDATKISMQTMSRSLEMYHAHLFRFPSADEGLRALVVNTNHNARWRGPYTEVEKLTDPWGEPFQYEIKGSKYELVSAGKDGALGTSDDIAWPDKDDDADERPVTAEFNVPTDKANVPGSDN